MSQPRRGNITSAPTMLSVKYMVRQSGLQANRHYNLSVDLNVTPSSQHFLGGLYIDDVEWRDYLRQHLDAGRAEFS